MRLSELPEARARYEEALPLYRAIGEKLGEANCIQALGELDAEEENYTSAFSRLEEAAMRYCTIGLPANEASAINSIGNIYESQKEYQKAIEAYTRAMALTPDLFGYVLRNRANVRLKLKDAKNAASDIEAAAKIQPDHPYLFLRRGELAILQGSYEEAVGHFNAALQHFPRMNGAHFGIGLAYLYIGQLQDAIEAYQHGLAFTYARKELKDAIEELERLQEEQPDLPGISDALTMLRSWQPSSIE